MKMTKYPTKVRKASTGVVSQTKKIPVGSGRGSLMSSGYHSTMAMKGHKGSHNPGKY